MACSAAFLDACRRGDAAGLAFLRNEPAANAVPAHLLAVEIRPAEDEPPTLGTLAARHARQGHKDLETICRDMQPCDAGFEPEERALISWGKRFLALKRYAEAVDIHRLATSLYPDSGRAMFSLAMTYDRQGDNAAALAASRRVPGFSPYTAFVNGAPSVRRIRGSGSGGQGQGVRVSR